MTTGAILVLVLRILLLPIAVFLLVLLGVLTVWMIRLAIGIARGTAPNPFSGKTSLQDANRFFDETIRKLKRSVLIGTAIGTAGVLVVAGLAILILEVLFR